MTVKYVHKLPHRVTVYVNQLGTWYDSRGHTEVLSSSVMAKVESSISTAGLTGVDKLLAFLIVQELQVGHTANMFTFVPLPSFSTVSEPLV